MSALNQSQSSYQAEIQISLQSSGYNLTQKFNPFGKHEKQRAFVLDSARYTWVEAGTKAGKTQGMLLWLALEALKGNGGEYWWVAPVSAQAKIAYRRLKRSLGKAIIAKSTKSPLRIELINGSAIEFKSADNPDSLYGEDVKAVVIDEASRTKEEAWYAVRSTLTATSGRAKIIGNVKGRKNWFYNSARRAEAGQPNHSYYKLTSADNPYISQEDIEDARRLLPESVFNEIYLAIPSEDGGNPFGLDAIHRCTQPLSNRPAVVYGVDLGKKVDWTVIIGLDVEGNVCYFDRFQRPWRQTQQELIKVIGNTPALIDATGLGDPILEELQAHCDAVEGFIFSPRSKQQLFEGLQVDIQNQLVSYPEGPITAELDTFEYMYTATGIKYSAPEGFHDDIVCALALVRVQYRKVAKYLHTIPVAQTNHTPRNLYA